MTDKYKVSIKGPGINVDRGVSEAQASQLLIALLTGRAPATTSAAHGLRESKLSSDASVQSIDSDSIAEYLGATSAKISPEKIAAIGSFLKHRRNKTSFNRDDLEASFLEAAESIPKNLPRDIKNAVRSRWIAPKPGEKGVYYVTGTGFKAVNSGFRVDSKREPAGTRRRKPRKPTKSTQQERGR